MDKPNNGNTISVKINGKHSPFNEDNQGIPPDKQKKERESSDKQPKQRESVEKESAAARESMNGGEEFDWILPSGSSLPKKEDSKIIYLEDKKKEKSPISFKALINKKNTHTQGQPKTKGRKPINITMLLSIFFAIILGTLFGLILLKLVPTEQVVVEEKPAAVNDQTNEQSVQPAANDNVEVTLKPISAVVVQEGIYSSQGAAESTLTALKEKGTPAAIIPVEGKFAIFVSMAETVADAKTIGKELNGNGIETFSKEFSISEKKINLQHEEEKKLLELSPQLFHALTVSVTSASVSSSIPAAAIENVEKETAILSKIDKDKLKNKTVIDMYSQLETASTQIKQYEKNPGADTLNKIQQSLLSFLASYQSL
ncbi:hypothetical protein R4Z09_06200 [Niallia oryzisoli]|uniref:SPOR domain-containing protein n=1 Tax=Niallia oryzisoli TaxID=1737571 RepID=A0ABZ2CFK6_9BACI